MTQETLKPCPFCGGEAEIINRMGTYFVKCSRDSKDCPTGVTVCYDLKFRAIKAWNRRFNE